MNSINNLGVFHERIVLSTKKDIFEGCSITYAKNIKDIANTTAKPSFIKKVFNKMERFSTLFMISQTGRIGISNRKGDVGKSNVNVYNESILKLNSRKDNFNNNIENIKGEMSVDLNDPKKLVSVIQFKNKVMVENHKVNYFISLIENENSSFKDRYSFFNYLNELQRAESFCRSSNNVDDNQLADVFKNILEERIGRVKKEDIKKIFNEVIIKYKNETQFKSRSKSTLANFSSNQDKEKFMAKINFLVSLSKYKSSIMNQVFFQGFPKQLQDIMHTILNEEHSNHNITFIPHMVKDVWIQKYMNEFHEYEKPNTEVSVGTNTENGINIDVGSDGNTVMLSGNNYYSESTDNSFDTASVNSSDYDEDVSDNLSDTVSVHNSDNNSTYSKFESIEDLSRILDEEVFKLFNQEPSISHSNNLQETIKNMLSELSILSNIVTDSLELSMTSGNKIMIPLENMTAFSNILHSIQTTLKSIEPDYSVGLNKSQSLYSKIQQSTEDISNSFEEIASLIKSSNSSDSIKSEIEILLKNIFNKINSSKAYAKKELLDNVTTLMNELIKDSKSKIAMELFENNKIEMRNKKLANNNIENEEIKEYVSKLKDIINSNSELAPNRDFELDINPLDINPLDVEPLGVKPLNVKLASEEKYLNINKLLDDVILEVGELIKDDAKKEQKL